MKKTAEFIVIFLLGAIAYCLIEVAFRERTHPTMLFAGGIIFLILYYFFTYIGKGRYFLKSLAGCIIITTAEYIFGLVFNLILGMNVWCYLGKPLNLFGQICPSFSFGWLLLSIPIAFIIDRISSFFKSQKT